MIFRYMMQLYGAGIGRLMGALDHYGRTLNLVEFSLISLSVHVFVEQRSVRTANVLKSLLNVSSLVSVEGSVAMHNWIELLLYHSFIMAFVNICISNSENGIILTPYP